MHIISVHTYTLKLLYYGHPGTSLALPTQFSLARCMMSVPKNGRARIGSVTPDYPGLDPVRKSEKSVS